MYLMYYTDDNGERVYTLKVRHAGGLGHSGPRNERREARASCC